MVMVGAAMVFETTVLFVLVAVSRKSRVGGCGQNQFSEPTPCIAREVVDATLVGVGDRHKPPPQTPARHLLRNSPPVEETTTSSLLLQFDDLRDIQYDTSNQAVVSLGSEPILY